MNYATTQTAPQVSGGSSTFDSILASVQAGIDAFRRGGADVGGTSGAQQQVAPSTNDAPGEGSSLLLIVALVAVAIVVFGE